MTAKAIDFPACLALLHPPPASRCIGSIQHLKSKFGKEYLLEMKVKTLAQVEPLHEEILRLFPQAARQER
jgi:hypothetical protein